MKKMIKRIVFAVIIVSLVLATGVVIKTGKFAKLEGYMYSFATEITNSATACNAQECSTSSNATSSNVQECATSSNATSSNATSSNVQECATGSNATSSNVQECATSSNATSSNVQENVISDKGQIIENNTELNESKEKEYIANSNGNVEVKDKVTFLESYKMYIMIIGVSVLAIVIVSIILIVDNKGIEKRRVQVNNNEEK